MSQREPPLEAGSGGWNPPPGAAGMAEDAFKIISLVFEDADPDGGSDHGHGALILIDLPMGDRPA